MKIKQGDPYDVMRVEVGEIEPIEPFRAIAKAICVEEEKVLREIKKSLTFGN